MSVMSLEYECFVLRYICGQASFWARSQNFENY
jgi:hypothetical protein